MSRSSFKWGETNLLLPTVTLSAGHDDSPPLLGPLAVLLRLLLWRSVLDHGERGSLL